MRAGAVWAIAVGVGTALLVAGCGEKPQTATQRKVDATAYSGSAFQPGSVKPLTVEPL